MLNRCSVALAPRWLSSQKIAANLIFYTEKPRQIVSDKKTLRFEISKPVDREIETFHSFYFHRLRQQEVNSKPLVVLLCWANARTRDLEKFCKLYTNLGFDVIVARTKIWHVLWPANGSFLANNIVKFLANNDYQRILLHGFSIGGFSWGQCLLHLHGSAEFASVSERIKAQVWDSIAGMKEIPIGVSKTVFLKNDVLQKAMLNAIVYFLQLRKNASENYYTPSEFHFHNKAIRVPALIFSSKSDLIGTEQKAQEIADSFRSQKIVVTSKCFNNSPHVGHFKKHKEEYLKHLMEHLKSCELVAKKYL
jgi:esterase/lipase